MVGCLINKAGSTSFTHTFLKLAGLLGKRSIPKQKLWKLASKICPQNETSLKYYLKKYFKFVFVREPMERLASCYLDKFVKNTKNGPLLKYRQKVQQMAKLLNKTVEEGKLLNKTIEERNLVTFQEFLEVEVLAETIFRSTLSFARHWKPYHQLCAPCEVNYDFIGHLDPSQNDIQVNCDSEIGKNTIKSNMLKLQSVTKIHIYLFLKYVFFAYISGTN